MTTPPTQDAGVNHADAKLCAQHIVRLRKQYEGHRDTYAHGEHNLALAYLALTAQLAAANADGERLDWLEARAFTVYRQRDPEHGTMPDHITVVDEDVRFRIGILGATVREALDAARTGAR